MRVQVRLHAVLKELIPDGSGELNLPDGSVISDVLDQLKVDSEFRELITVNGVQISDLNTSLKEGDRLEVFPAVAGGAAQDRRTTG